MPEKLATGKICPARAGNKIESDRLHNWKYERAQTDKPRYFATVCGSCLGKAPHSAAMKNEIEGRGVEQLKLNARREAEEIIQAAKQLQEIEDAKKEILADKKAAEEAAKAAVSG